MSFLPRCLRIGYVLTFLLVIFLLAGPGQSRGQFRRNMVPMTPLALTPFTPVNPFTPFTPFTPFSPFNFGVTGFGSFVGFDRLPIGIGFGGFPVGFGGFPGFGIGTFNGMGFNGIGFNGFGGLGFAGKGFGGFNGRKGI